MTGYPVGNSVFGTGTATAPAAAAAISTIAAGLLPAGLYHILAYCEYGAVAGGEDDIDMRAGATVIAVLRIDAVANSNTPVAIECVRVLDGSTALTLNSVAGGGAGSKYKGTIVATPIRS